VSKRVGKRIFFLFTGLSDYSVIRNPVRLACRWAATEVDVGGKGGEMATRKDTDIVLTVAEARSLCAKDTTARVKRRDRLKPCCRCGGTLRWDVDGNHPQGVTLDHLGVQVSDCVGMPRGQAKRLLNDTSQLGLSHRVCNSSSGRGSLPAGRHLVPTAYAPTTTRTPSRDW
jgi:hypothetical protein